MSLSLTTRRRLQTSSNKWSSQQHLGQQDSFLRQQVPPPMRKQRSFIEATSNIPSYTNIPPAASHNSYVQRGLSVGRSQDATTQRVFNRQLLKKHQSFADQLSSGRKVHDGGKTLSVKESSIRKNISSSGRIEHPSRSLQAWASTSSILKSLDKELAHLNGALTKSNDIKHETHDPGVSESPLNAVKRINTKPKNESGPQTSATTNQLNTKLQKPSNVSSALPYRRELSKVNLSIVLSHALNGSREYDSLVSDQADEEEGPSDSSEIEKLNGSKCNLNAPSGTSETPVLPHQRQNIYNSTKHLANSTNSVTSNSSSTAAIESQNLNNLNASLSLTIQKRPPLARAMSAPVRSYDESSKGTFLTNKRKSRRRKLNGRNITCEKVSDDQLLNIKNLNLDSKQKVLQRSRSVAPDVITLVSLISSEGSDSEKEDCSNTTPANSNKSSPTRRAPSLRKTGKSVSFQENYPPTFQFASKEYSHMLRRGSIAPLAARIKSNRPPTAPPVSILHPANGNISISAMESHQIASGDQDNVKSKAAEPCSPLPTTTYLPKKIEVEESYEYPEYVRSLKERECWKLYQKMSAKGVNITYDTILRGMLTPTEFRQLQRQREVQEAKTLKENEEMSAHQEEQPKPKNRLTITEKLN